MERRLAAVLIADVAGYGRLSQIDEEGTRARFQADLHEIFEPTIATHHGRLIKTMGDGLLVEFHSVVDALRCAIEAQRAKAKRNASLAADRRLAFRIGINLGDVIVEGDDIHGDGVNIADRLQGLGDEGGVMISGTAYDQVRMKLDVGYEFRGERRVKNIAGPVRVYRVLLDPKEAGKTIVRRAAVESWRGVAVAAALILVVVAGAAAWWRPWELKDEPAPLERTGLPLPDKPSIAVLPFVNMSGDPQQEYFADGMTDDLITDLSQISGLFVIARNSSFTYKDKAVDVRAISRELGVRYVLEGSIQRSADQIRINAQLIDATTGGHQWAERFEGSPGDIFALQDRVTSKIADALALRLTAAERQSVGQQETRVSEAYDALLRGWEHYRSTTPEDYARAVSHFEEAIRLDQSYARAYAALALIYISSYQRGWTESLRLTRNEAYGRAKQYLDMSNEQHTTSTSRQVAGLMYISSRSYDAAIAAFGDAIARDPGDSWSYAYKAFALSRAGRSAEARSSIDEALRRDPHAPPYFVFLRGVALFGLDRFEEAAESLANAARRNPDDKWPFVFLAASYGYLGRAKDAISAIAQANTLSIKLEGSPVSVVEATYGWDSAKSADSERLSKGLRMAGMPELIYSWLTADQLRALLLGRSVRGRSPGSGAVNIASVTTDSVVTMSGDWGTTSAAAIRIEGGGKGGQVCIEPRPAGHGSCAAVYINVGGTAAKENEFIWLDDSGTYPFSQVQ